MGQTNLYLKKRGSMSLLLEIFQYRNTIWNIKLRNNSYFPRPYKRMLPIFQGLISIRAVQSSGVKPEMWCSVSSSCCIMVLRTLTLYLTLLCQEIPIIKNIHFSKSLTCSRWPVDAIFCNTNIVRLFLLYNKEDTCASSPFFSCFLQKNGNFRMNTTNSSS